MDMSRLWAQRAIYETALKNEEEAIRNRLSAYDKLESMVWETVYNFTDREPEKMLGKHLFLEDDGKVVVMFLYRKNRDESEHIAIEIDIKNNEIRYI